MNLGLAVGMQISVPGKIKFEGIFYVALSLARHFVMPSFCALRVCGVREYNVCDIRLVCTFMCCGRV